MLTPDHKGAPRALEQAVAAERAKLVSAHAVQKCLYQVLLYAEGEDAVVHAEAAQVVASLMEFLGLRDGHSEADLHGGLLQHLGRFITELGQDFCFVGSQYPVQVGDQDFAIDLLFFHRGLSCLVAIELKVREFRPEDLGKLSFYVEALDRDVKKPHERPSIGVLLCATKHDEVVEYALARTASPTLVAEYQTVLPSKDLLRGKLHELYARLAPESTKSHWLAARLRRRLAVNINLDIIPMQ